MSDIIILCRNLDVATNLGNRFIETLTGTGEYKSSTECGRIVHTTYGDRYYFTNYEGSNKLLQGRHEVEMHTDTFFEDALDSFPGNFQSEEIEPEVRVVKGIPWAEDPRIAKKIMNIKNPKSNNPKSNKGMMPKPQRRNKNCPPGEDTLRRRR